MEIEEWRPIPGYESIYEVSSHGRVRSLPREWYQAAPQGSGTVRRITPGRVLSPEISRTGYCRAQLTIARRTVKKFHIHRLVLEAFIGPCPPGHVVCHWDGDPSNNCLSNLRYGTRAENERDKIRHGRRRGAMGTANASSRLTEQDARAIFGARGVQQIALAEHFGVTQSVISRIRNGRAWAHATGATQGSGRASTR